MKKQLPFISIILALLLLVGVVLMFTDLLKPNSSLAQDDVDLLIVFSSDRDGDLDIYVMNSDGSNQVNLTNNDAQDWNPDWSPDGLQIIFASDRDGNPELYVMNIDGSGVQRLTENEATDDEAQWQPVPGQVPALAVEPPEASQPADEPPVSQADVTSIASPPVSGGELGVVPDLTGLNVPQAAALLNRHGLQLGDTDIVSWTAVAPAPPGTIGGQSVAPGESIAQGTSVGITLLRTTNALLIYDDNDITLVNQSNDFISMDGIRFSSVDGSSPASFLASSRWGQSLRAGRCGQLWSVVRNGFKGLDECNAIQAWGSVTDPQEHFWTGTNGATQFNVIQNGRERGICEIAAGRCELYLSTEAVADEDMDYIYFAYTPDRLSIQNTSTDQWLPLGEVVLLNYLGSEEGAPIPVGDRSLYTAENIIGDVSQLAPGQCLFFTNGSPVHNQPPQNCDVVTQLDLSPNVIFWSQGFGVTDPQGENERRCPTPIEGNLTLCVLPR